ncbi:Cytochrome c oxidase assembly factor 6 [Halocaridina rubra]|uniref:Cytochrome c oxidase assembly factor 6 n=1 Tax=Halocaridina rubra TaxID=373956 RepID=A0AAN9A8G4_HALRR
MWEILRTIFTYERDYCKTNYIRVFIKYLLPVYTIIMPREEGVKTTSFPNKEARYQCWNSRDKYWECLSGGGTEGTCKEFRKQYEEDCPSAWIKHFDRKRNYDVFKEQMKHGYEPLDDKKA